MRPPPTLAPALVLALVQPSLLALPRPQGSRLRSSFPRQSFLLQPLAQHRHSPRPLFCSGSSSLCSALGSPEVRGPEGCLGGWVSLEVWK